MATQARRGGSRRRRGTDQSGATPTPAIEPIEATVAAPVVALTTDDAELTEDRTVAITGSHRAMSLRRSLPGAVAGALLVVGIAFGAAGPGGAFGPKGDSNNAAIADAGDGFADERRGGTGSGGDDKTGDDAYGTNDESSDGAEVDETKDGGTSEPGTDEQPAPDPTPKPEPKPEPTKKPAPKPEPKPEPATIEQIAIGLGIKYHHPVIEWGSCAGLDFDYYKVIRSKDSTVTWPTGTNDALAAVVERGGERRAWDKDAPHGMKVWYRVFCVRKTEAGYKVLNSSDAKGIWVPEETPPPDPITLALEANVNDDGKVVLDWSACKVDGFAFYKVVKSTWNENPSYLPWTDGTDVIGVIENVATTELLDWAPDPGHTAWYRIQCLGYVDGQKVLIGESPVVSVTTP